MPAIPVLRPREVVKVFKRFGWVVARQRGSHIIMIKQGQIETLSIPNHTTVARGTLRALITRARISVDEFLVTFKS